MRCYFCDGTPSNEDLDRIYRRDFPEWLCYHCKSYLEANGSLAPVAELFCSCCKQDDRNCECRIRDIAGHEASPNYGELLVTLIACEWGQEDCICAICTGDCGRTDPTIACQECQHCQYDPADFDRKEFTCGHCGWQYNWDCLDEDGLCLRCEGEQDEF